MTTTNLVTPVIPEAIRDVSVSMLHLLRSFSKKGLNTVPTQGSWTAAQVADHVTRSNKSMLEALSLEGKATTRQPDEKVEELKEVFLNLTTKLNAPDFTLPGQDHYDPEGVIDDLYQSYERLITRIGKTDLSECIEHPIFGEITRLELMCFVVFHTQRHTHQLERIYRKIEQRNYKFLSFLFTSPTIF